MQIAGALVGLNVSRETLYDPVDNSQKPRRALKMRNMPATGYLADPDAFIDLLIAAGTFLVTACRRTADYT